MSDSAQLASQVRVTLVRRIYRVHPITEILELRDSLGLSVEQVTNIGLVRTSFDRTVDSLLSPVVAFAVQRGNKLTGDELNEKMNPIGRVLVSLVTSERLKAWVFLLPELRTSSQH